jgi:TctA family transporter
MNSAAAAGVARGILTATPGRATAVATTASKKEIAKTGSGSPIGGMATVAVTVEADTAVAAMVATVADRLPDMAAALVARVVGVDVAVADEAAAIKRQSPKCPPYRMQDFANLF